MNRKKVTIRLPTNLAMYVEWAQDVNPHRSINDILNELLIIGLENKNGDNKKQ